MKMKKKDFLVKAANKNKTDWEKKINSIGMSPRVKICIVAPFGAFVEYHNAKGVFFIKVNTKKRQKVKIPENFTSIADPKFYGKLRNFYKQKT